MSNQDDFQRITSLVIKPIERHFNCQFDAETIGDYIDDLSRFSTETLQESMFDIRREQKRRPSLAVVFEACRKNAPKTKDSIHDEVKNKFHCAGHAEIFHSRVAEEILSTPAGQMALEIGVGIDLLNEYECTGRKEFDNGFVMKCKKGMEDAALVLIECKNITEKEIIKFKDFYHCMRERESRIYAKYYVQKAAA